MSPAGNTPEAVNSLLKDLHDLQNFTTQFHNVVSAARQAAPPRASGHDASGVVSAEVDSEGVPQSLTIASGWQHRLAGHQLGPAVTEAYQTAIQGHLQQWSDDLQREGWQYDAREMDAKVAAMPPPEEPVFPVPTSAGPPRGISSLLGELVGELDFAHDLANQPPAPSQPLAQPSESGARVRVSITHGQLESVHIDAEWAEGKDAAAINGELAAALQSARLSQPQATTRPPHTDRLDSLLGDVMNFMSHHRSEK